MLEEQISTDHQVSPALATGYPKNSFNLLQVSN